VTPHETIPLFGALWWQSNLTTVFIIAAVIWLGKRVPREKAVVIGYVIGTILIARAILIHPYQVYLGRWNIHSNLPLQMCAIASILSGVAMFTRNQWVYEFLYYWGLPGAFHSLLTPEFTLGKEGLMFYEYFLSHGGIILSALYATLVLGMKPRRGSWWRIALWSQIPVAIVGFIDWLIDANYMYLCQRPIVENPFVIGEWPWYILGLEAAGLLHFIIVYLPFGLKYRREVALA
jgi:hypothetical integral membrane protein (TIGR02206 family)